MIALLQNVGTLLLLVCTTVQDDGRSVARLVEALQSRDAATQLTAIDQLGTQGEQAAQAVPALSTLLKDESPVVRAHAARALGQIGGPAKSAAAALTLLLKDDDATVRRKAINALVAIRPGADVMIPLYVKLLEDSDPGVRMRILHATADAGPAAVPSLIKALDNEKACYWACLVLREMGPVAKQAVPTLVETLKNSRPEIRREAALALGAMKDAAAPAVPQLVVLLDDSHARTAAIFALGQIGQMPKGAQAKVRGYTQSDDKFLSMVSLWALITVHPNDKELGREAAELFFTRLMDQDPYVRVAAARALATLPPAPEIMLPIWEKTMQNADKAAVHHALDALASLGPAAVPRLIDALEYKQLQAQVAYILGQIGPAAAPAVEPLTKLVGDSNAQVATEAALALAKIGSQAKPAVPQLIAALQCEDCLTAHAIVYALGKIGPGAMKAEPKLVETMNSKDRALAVLSAWALTQLHSESPEVVTKALPVLISGLSLPLPESRQSAAEALGTLGPLAADAVPALEKATQDPKPSVRTAASEALRKVRQPAEK